MNDPESFLRMPPAGDGFSLSLLAPVLPEMFLAGVGLLLLVVGAFRGDRGMHFVLSATLAAFIAAIVLVLQTEPTGGSAFGGMVVVDSFASWMTDMPRSWPGTRTQGICTNWSSPTSRPSPVRSQTRPSRS